MKALSIIGLLIVGFLLMFNVLGLIPATGALMQDGDNGYNLGAFLGRIVIGLVLLSLFLRLLKRVW